jgi:NADPH-dependent curcumin reductase CurA
MIINLCKIQNIPLINIVRKQDQVKILKEEYGCDFVLNQNEENFSEKLR